jgi:hypothetical protein
MKSESGSLILVDEPVKSVSFDSILFESNISNIPIFELAETE